MVRKLKPFMCFRYEWAAAKNFLPFRFVDSRSTELSHVGMTCGRRPRSRLWSYSSVVAKVRDSLGRSHVDRLEAYPKVLNQYSLLYAIANSPSFN
jgi:hypothetical protein